MTQQPYYGTPADPYSPQPAQQYPPPGYQQVPNGYAPAPQGYGPPPQQYGPPAQQGYQAAGGYAPQQPPQPQAPVGAKGTLDQFHQQPHTGGGKGISFKQKPDGYTYVLVVSRTPGDEDLFQDSDPQTKTLKTWRDGSPKMVLPVQCNIIPQDQWQAAEYADGDASFYLRGGLRDEVTRAMAEVGESGVPQAGALVVITLTHRKPGNNIATNMYAVKYHPAGSHNTVIPAPQQAQPVQGYAAPTQAPYQQQAPTQYAAPAQAAPNPQQYAQPQYGAAPAYDPNQYQQAPAQPTYQAAPQGQYSSQAQAAPAQYAPNPQAAPIQQPGLPPQPPQAPPGVVQAGVVQSQLSPEKQALLATMSGQQGQAPQQPQG